MHIWKLKTLANQQHYKPAKKEFSDFYSVLLKALVKLLFLFVCLFVCFSFVAFFLSVVLDHNQEKSLDPVDGYLPCTL